VVHIYSNVKITASFYYAPCRLVVTDVSVDQTALGTAVAANRTRSRTAILLHNCAFVYTTVYILFKNTFLCYFALRCVLRWLQSCIT
jgi:hypothetical protein